MTHVSIEIDDKEKKILSKRAEKNLFSLKEQVEDIIRRSCVNASSAGSTQEKSCDDNLVSIFSRQKRGSKNKKKKNK